MARLRRRRKAYKLIAFALVNTGRLPEWAEMDEAAIDRALVTLGLDWLHAVDALKTQGVEDTVTGNDVDPVPQLSVSTEWDSV